MIQYGEREIKPAEAKVEGTIDIVAPRGLVTLDDGTILAVPKAVMPHDLLRPGVVIVAEYRPKGHRKVATAVQFRESRRQAW